MAWRRRRCRPAPPLPFVLRSHFTLADGPPAVSREAPVSSERPLSWDVSRPDLGLPDRGLGRVSIWDFMVVIRSVAGEVAKLFPNLHGQPSAGVVRDEAAQDRRRAFWWPGSRGGHNVIFWIFGCGRSPAAG